MQGLKEVTTGRGSLMVDQSEMEGRCRVGGRGLEPERGSGKMSLRNVAIFSLADQHPSFPALGGFTNESNALRLLHSMSCFMTRTQTSNFKLMSFSSRFLNNLRPVL